MKVEEHTLLQNLKLCPKVNFQKHSKLWIWIFVVVIFGWKSHFITLFLEIEFLDRIWDFVTVCRGDHVWTHKAARRNFELDSWSSSSLFALLHLRSFFHFLESWINHDSARGNSGFDTKTVALETTVAIFRKQGLLDSVPFKCLNFRAKNEKFYL